MTSNHVAQRLFWTRPMTSHQSICSWNRLLLYDLWRKLIIWTMLYPRVRSWMLISYCVTQVGAAVCTLHHSCSCSTEHHTTIISVCPMCCSMLIAVSDLVSFKHWLQNNIFATCKCGQFVCPYEPNLWASRTGWPKLALLRREREGGTFCDIRDRRQETNERGRDFRQTTLG